MSITIKNKVKGLCSSCRNSTMVELMNGEVLVKCRAVFEMGMYSDGAVPGPVKSCSSYADASSPDVWTMEKVAWILDPSKREIGFTRPGTQEHRLLTKEHYNYDDD